MKRAIETLPASSGAKKPKSDENLEKRNPESAEAQLESVILPEIVNIKTEDAQSIDDHLLLSKPELNLELIVKEEYIVQENTWEIAQNPNKVKKMDDQRRMMIPNHVSQATCSRNGIQEFYPLQNQDETSSKDQGNDIFLVDCPKFIVKSESGYDIPEHEDEKSFRRLTNDEYIVKKLICKEKYLPNTEKVGFGLVLINCPLCPEIINDSDAFIQHAFSYHRFYVCLACNLISEYKTFAIHLREIHETRPFLECEACDFSATNRLEWTFHLQSHLQKSLEKIRRVSLPHAERYECSFCLCSYPRKESYLSHLKSEHRFFECVACAYNAASQKDLKQHLNELHRNGDTFDCNKCRFSAAFIGAWNHHFISGDHVRGVTKSGDFSCTKCFFNAKNVTQANFHLQKVHSIFCCIFCDEFEANKRLMLKSHIHEKHKVSHKQKRVNCNICPFRGEKPGLSHIEHFKDQHKEAKKTTLNSILAQGFALQISRKSQPIENDSVKQEIGEEEPSTEAVLINEDDIKVEIDFCEIKNE